MWTTFRNAWKIVDLRKRILFTLFILIIFRLGSALPVPFINLEVLKEYMGSDELQQSILGFADFINGGALSSGSIFSLGVQPYINASIIMQLLAVAFPALERLQKGGPDEQQKFQRITRYAGAVLGLGLGVGYYFVLRNGNMAQYSTGSFLWEQIFSAFVIIMCFTAGALLVTWLGEQIDQKGIGNGVSMLIFAGIVSRTPSTIAQFVGYWGLGKSMPSFYIWIPVLLVLEVVAIVLVVILNGAERRIPVQYAKRVVGRKMYGGQSSHMPIKVNMSGVMPVIFASSLTSIPGTIGSFFTEQVAASPFWKGVLDSLSQRGIAYAVIYGLLIVVFNYFYVAITYNPLEMANNLKKNSGAIPGIRPGKPTSEFIARTISRVTIVGAIFLVVVAVGPIFLGMASQINIQMMGTSLLIVVGVALDTARSLESFMLMRHHKGFLE